MAQTTTHIAGRCILVGVTLLLAGFGLGAYWAANEGANSLKLLLESPAAFKNRSDVATDAIGGMSINVCLHDASASSTCVSLSSTSSESQTSSTTASMSQSASYSLSESQSASHSQTVSQSTSDSQTRSSSHSRKATKTPQFPMDPAPSCRPKVRRGVPMEIEAQAGLTNRFRVILSYLKEARRTGRSLIVYWVPDRHCNGHFHSVFDLCALPDDLTILPALPTYPVSGTFRDFPGRPWPTDRGSMSLELFKPTPAVKARIYELRAQLNGSFSAGVSCL